MRYPLLLLFLCLWGFGSVLGQTEPELTHLASHETGTEAAAETVAFDPGSNRVFFTNGAANQLGILDLTKPANPVLVSSIDLSPYGAAPNSVDVANGLVAVAVQADPKTSPGVIVFLDTNGNFLGQRTVGALPDMVLFTHDGTKLLVANEGEPDDDYLIDPVGSVSIIDVSGDIANAPVVSVGFANYNDKAESLRNKGIRLFGPNASVAQDLEPEYISITADDSRAYVSCQEANALAVIDIATATVLDILPLGYKDHMNGNPVLNSFILNELTPFPILGTPAYDGGQDPVYLGGFSGMWFDAAASSPSQWVFYTVPDRGPNGDPVAKATVTPPAAGNLRPYKLPDYQARIVKFTVNPASQSVSIDDQILLVGKDGLTPISGKGNIPGFDEVPVAYTDPATDWATVDYTDPNGEEYTELPYDPMGGDMEGIIRDNDGNFWLCDENRPALYKVQPNGTLIERYVPEGTSLLGTIPQPAGTYGMETLPSLYSNRWANRGFEAIAFDPIKNVVYAFIQSPIENPGPSVRNKTDVIRILGVDAATGLPVEEYVYLLERNRYPGIGTSRVDKMGDAVWVGPNRFLVIERDSEGPGVSEGKKFIFEINLTGAVNIFGTELARRDGYTTQIVQLLSGSAPVTDESTAPFLMPAEFTQTLIVDRNTANNDPDFAATFGNWDMITLDPSNRYVFIPAETGTGAGLTRYDRQTGDFVTAMTGNNSGVFATDPAQWDLLNDDFGALDPAEWTPNGTVIAAEEWSGVGRMFEWMNPLMEAGEVAQVRWLSNIPSVSHEGLKFDEDGTLYFIDENNSGSIYKFVPSDANDLTKGQVFVLVVDDFAGNPAANWNDPANLGATRFGPATWVPITDADNQALTMANPFSFDASDRGGRLAADEVNGTPYGRPEDLELVDGRLYCAVTSEHLVLSIDLISDTEANVGILVDRNTLDSGTGLAVDTDLANPDNLASDSRGNIYVIEDNNPGDIWMVRDADHNGQGESMARFASLGVAGSEPTGFIKTNHPNQFMVCIQHPSTGNDALWMITGSDTLRVPSNDKTLEQHSADELVAAGIRPVHKNKVVNLPTLGYESSDKAEGIAWLPGNRIAVLNDNDFGLAGAGVTDNSVLGVISFDGLSGMDPSDKDGKTEIVSVPTWGMYLPDAVAMATIGGKSYIITANEGDSRDYDGYSEEERVKDLVLDADAYPNAAALQADGAIGRLKTTSANGDFDQDGDVDQIYSFGGRSFSIFDAYGNLVWDSGDQFARKTLVEEPELFNEDEGEADGRSDDKGVEPEAVAVGVIDGKTYAFVGFERQSAIVAYDISNPWAPEFVTWYSNRDVDTNGDVTGDVSPEIIKFVSAADSPNGENLLVVGYEVSGSVGIIQVGGDISAIDTETPRQALFKTWPNPTVSTLNTDTPVTGQIVDLNGRAVASFQQATSIDVRSIEPGVYMIHTLEHGIRRFLKL